MKALSVRTGAAVVAACLAVCASRADSVVESLELDGTAVTFSENTVVSNLTASANTSVTVQEGVTLDVISYGGDQLMQIYGAGTVRIFDLADDDAHIEANQSVTLRFCEPTAGTDTHALASAAAFHVDAMEAGSLDSVQRAGTNYVSVWRDVRGEGHPYAFNSTGTNLPWLVSDALPWIDTGSYWYNTSSTRYGGWLEWSVRDTSVREVFLVVSDTPDVRKITGNTAMPFLLCDPSSKGGAYHFHRGYANENFALFTPRNSYPSANVTNGVITLDRVRVGPYEPLPEGFHLVHIRTDGPVTAGSFANDRGIRKGGLRFREAIVFDSLLDDSTASALEARLHAKWFRRVVMLSLHGTVRLETETPISVANVYSSPNDCNVFSGDFSFDKAGLFGQVRVESGRITVLGQTQGGDIVGDLQTGDADSEIYRIGETGDYTKTSGGNLTVRALSATNIAVEVGSLAVEMLSASFATYFHVDASAAGTVKTSGSMDNMPLVTEWQCVRGHNKRYASSEDGTRPRLRADFLNGLPVIDFGSPKYKGKSWHGFDDGYGGYLTWSDRMTKIREVFWVFSDTEEWAETRSSSTPGTFLLGDTSKYEFHRASSKTRCAFFNSSNAGAHVREGTLRCDGAEVEDPTSTVISEGFHVIHLRTKDGTPATAGTFAYDRGYIMGGQRLAEVIVYTNQTTDVERDAVEAYLRNKWFNAGAPGGRYGTVRVAEGARVSLPRYASATSVEGPGTVVSRGGLAVLNVSGGASFEGNLALEDGATVTVSNMVAVTVGGTLTLPAHGTLVLNGDVPSAPLSGRTETVVSAGAISGSVDGWTVRVPRLGKMYKASAAVAGDEIRVTFYSGFLITVR